MGLHINKKLLNNENYKQSVKNDLEKLLNYVNEVAENYNPDHAQELCDLLSGKESINYVTYAGEESTLTFETLKFDKLDKDAFTARATAGEVEDDDDDLEEDEERTDEYSTGVNEMTASMNGHLFDLLKDINTVKGQIGEKNVADEYVDLFPTFDINKLSNAYRDDFARVESAQFEKEEIEQNKIQIENNKFGYYGASEIYSKTQNLSLSDKILKHLGARNTEDWLDCISSKEAIDDYVRYYDRSQGNVHLNDANYAIGRLIVESQDGKDIDENNIKPILNDMKAKNDEYKQINWFRRAVSYVNPFKDSVRDMRNDINNAKEMLAEKNLDMKQLDAFLDGKANINSVKVPENGPYQTALNAAMSSLRQVNGVVNSGDYKEGLEHLKIHGAQLEKIIDHELEIVNPEDVKANDKYPLDDEVQKSMDEMNGPQESEKFVEQEVERVRNEEIEKD